MKRKSAYVPSRGDLVWLSFDPQLGHEQRGRRPALVLSPESYNSRVGLAVFCPITTQAKGYTFEVKLPDGLPIVGAVLADQVKSLDWRERQPTRAGGVSDQVLEEVIGKLAALIGVENDG